MLEISTLAPDVPERWEELHAGIYWRCRRGCTAAARLEAIEPKRRILAAQLEERLAIDEHGRNETRLERIEREMTEATAGETEVTNVTKRTHTLTPDTPPSPPSAVVRS